MSILMIKIARGHDKNVENHLYKYKGKVPISLLGITNQIDTHTGSNNDYENVTSILNLTDKEGERNEMKLKGSYTLHHF